VNSPTSRAVKKVIQDLSAKSLSISHDLATRTLELRLMLTLIVKIKRFTLPTPMFSPLCRIPHLIQLLAPFRVDVLAAFDSQDEVVKDDATSDPHNHPHMFLVGVDLNAKLEQGLKPAFQQTDCMFDADPNL